MTARRAARRAAAALLLLALALGLALEWVPNDADQGFSQRIFYLHVPVALTAYACFGTAAWKALRVLGTGDERYDVESSVAVHVGTIFGALTLLTGSIWARISWGVWWTWSENQLVLFLVIFLFYSTYFMLRHAVPAGTARERLSAVFALVGVVLIPVSFLAIRLAANFIHPVVITQRGPQMAPSMLLAFTVSVAGMFALASALYAFEVAGKLLDRRLRTLRELIA